MKRKNHYKTLLELMLKNSWITAGLVYGISNANHYLGELQKRGVIKGAWVVENGSRFKKWWIVDYAKALKIINTK